MAAPKEPRATASGTKSKSTGLRVQGVAGNCNERLKIQLQATRLDHHNLPITDYGYVERVFTNLRRKLNRTEDDELFDLKTNVLIWGLFILTTVKSAIRLGLEDGQNLIACQNNNFEGVKTLFGFSLKLISENHSKFRIHLR